MRKLPITAPTSPMISVGKIRFFNIKSIRPRRVQSTFYPATLIDYLRTAKRLKRWRLFPQARAAAGVSERTLPSRSLTIRRACPAMFSSCVTMRIVGPSAWRLAKSCHEFFARRRVEVAGRLVGQQDRRVVDECARDRDPLLLTAGELARLVVGAVGEPDLRQHGHGACTAFAAGDAGVEERQRDVAKSIGARPSRLKP